MYYEGKIDKAVLLRIANGGTSFIFEETYRCDRGSSSNGYFNAAAYCNSINRNIVQFFHQDNFDYYTKSIVHETGHAFDFTLRYESIGEIGCGITQFTYKDISSGKLSENLINDLYGVDSDGWVLTWNRIIDNEANYFDESHGKSNPCCIKGFQTKEEADKFIVRNCINSTCRLSYDESSKSYQLVVTYDNSRDSKGVTVGGRSSIYNVHDYVNLPHEYFADAFQAYYIGDGQSENPGEQSRFEYLCPETYAAIDSLIQKENIKLMEDNYG